MSVRTHCAHMFASGSRCVRNSLYEISYMSLRARSADASRRSARPSLRLQPLRQSLLPGGALRVYRAVRSGHVKRPEQCVERDRLAQELIERRIESAHAEIETRPSGDRYEPHAEQRRIHSKATRRLESVHMRHVEIEERGVRPDRLAELDSLDAIGARVHFDAGVPQHRVECDPKQIIVVGQDELAFTGREHVGTFAARC